MNLLVTLDQNYFPQLQVLLTSLELNNPGEKFCLYLLQNRLPEELLVRTADWCHARGYGFCPVQMMGELFQEAPSNERYPVEMYYRLLAGQMLPRQVDKIIYLDHQSAA